MHQSVGWSLWRSAFRKVMLSVANYVNNGLRFLLDRCMPNLSTLQGAGEECSLASILGVAAMANSEA